MCLEIYRDCKGGWTGNIYMREGRTRELFRLWIVWDLDDEDYRLENNKWKCIFLI